MASLVNILSNAIIQHAQPTAPAAANSGVKSISANPFGKNPFVNYNGNRFDSTTYAKNQPVRGGYFAGYYNGKQNIVGRRLFIEV